MKRKNSILKRIIWWPIFILVTIIMAVVTLLYWLLKVLVWLTTELWFNTYVNKVEDPFDNDTRRVWSDYITAFIDSERSFIELIKCYILNQIKD